jgi:hypothetical protein
VRWDLEPGCELEVHFWTELKLDRATSFAFGKWPGASLSYSYPVSVIKQKNLIKIHDYQRPKEWALHPDYNLIQGVLEIHKVHGVPEMILWHREFDGTTTELERGHEWEFFEPVTPEQIPNIRGRKLVSQIERPAQGIIRRMLLVTRGMCAISGCAIEACLEAAHLLPGANGGIEAFDNMILLRSDLHRLFDAGLISLSLQNNKLRVCADATVLEYVKNSIPPCANGVHRDYSATKPWLDRRNELQPPKEVRLQLI